MSRFKNIMDDLTDQEFTLTFARFLPLAIDMTIHGITEFLFQFRIAVWSRFMRSTLSVDLA